MTAFLQFMLYGLGTGSIVALLGLGLVLIYRGSGTINLAHGAFAMLGAYNVHDFRDTDGLPVVPALVLGIATVAVAGLLVQLVLMRPLRGRSPLVRVIASLGVLSVVQSGVVLRYGATTLFVSRTLPQEPASFGPVTVGQQSLWLLGIAVLATVSLWLLSSRTRIGLAVTAAAANQRGTSALGFSPNLLACGTWALGGALAGLAGSLLPSLKVDTLNVNDLALTIISALAAALLGRFSSYPLVLAGGLAIGIAQSECANYVSVTGVADAVPFAFVVAVLVVRGRGLPVRGTTADRLPVVAAPARSPLLTAAVTVACALLCALVLPTDWVLAITVSTTFAIVGLSIVVVTGYGGQLSLAQFALGGIGAWAAGRLVSAHGWPFEAAFIAGVVTSIVVGLLFGVPALRTRGVNLAVITLGLGFAAWSLVFNSSDLTGGQSGTPIATQTLFGVSIDPIAHPGSYAAVCVAVFGVLAIAVGNLRRGRAGRRLLAVRANERAAASLGISVTQSKLYAFALGAAIAGVGGILYAFSYSSIEYGSLFQPFSSISVMTFAVIGGIGFTSGPLYGSLLASGGVAALLSTKSGGGISDDLDLIGGIVLLVLLLAAPNGVAAGVARVTRALGPQVPGRRSPSTSADPADTPPVARQALEVRGLTVRFGGVTAVEDVNLVVRPGTVVGVLGPNGAGKTTLVDAITGYTRPAAGAISLGAGSLDGLSPHLRSRAGIGRSFQSLELFDDMTVLENLRTAADDHADRVWLTDLLRPEHARVTPGVARAIVDTGISDLLDLPCQDLSYGRRRLVAMARALCTGPSVLLLDEPAAGLDNDESRAMGVLIRRLADERGMAVLLIEHDVDMVMRTADEILVLDFGRAIAFGPPAEVRADPAVRAAYLGAQEPAPPVAAA